jgi:cytoskeletal protein CcmA (bactofilin family)
MAIPTAPTDTGLPDWTDLVNSWHAVDAEWLRNHSVPIFVDGTNTGSGRGALYTAPQKGALSVVQSGDGSPDFYNGSAWTSVRYPGLDVSQPTGSTVLLRATGASPGTGIQLMADGSTNTAKGFFGAGGVGSTLDNTGIAIHIGAKTVKLATDGTQLTIDSPVSIAGALTLTGALTVPSETITGALTVQGASSLAAVTAASLTVTGTSTLAAVNASGTVTGATLQAGTTQITGNQLKANAGTAALTIGTDSTVSVAGTTLTVNPTTNFVGRPWLALPSTAPVWVAGIIAVQGTAAPTQNAPDGTLYVTY